MIIITKKLHCTQQTHNFTQHINRMMMINQAFVTKFTTIFLAIIAHSMIEPTLAANSIFVQFNDYINTRNSTSRTVVDCTRKCIASCVEENKYDFSVQTIKQQYDND